MMEPIMEIITDGLGFGDSTVEICRKRLSGLVSKGLISDSEFKDILADIDQDVNEKRLQMVSCIRSEMKRLISIMAPDTENGSIMNHNS